MAWQDLPPETRQQLTRTLTGKQLDVLILWLAGCSYQQISDMLGRAPRTVRSHLKAARRKYDQITKEAA